MSEIDEAAEAARDHYETEGHHPMRGQFIDAFSLGAAWAKSQAEAEIAAEKGRSAKLVEAMRRLKNEATGFVNMADRDVHGDTNISVLRHWISNANDALAAYEGSEP